MKTRAVVLGGLCAAISMSCDVIDQQVELGKFRWEHEVRPPTASGPGPWLSELPAGDTLEVDVNNSGCFHHELGTVIWQAGSLPRLWVRAPDGTSAELPVEDGMVAAFDRWLQYLRRKDKGGCTTVVLADVSWYSGSRLLDKSRYVDATCGTPFYVDGRPNLDLGLSAVEIMDTAAKSHGLKLHPPLPH